MITSQIYFPEVKLRALWRRIDIDSSGSISCNEFKRALEPYIDAIIAKRTNRPRKATSDNKEPAFTRNVSADLGVEQV